MCSHRRAVSILDVVGVCPSATGLVCSSQKVGVRPHRIFPWFLRTIIIIIKLFLYISSEANASWLDVSALIAW